MAESRIVHASTTASMYFQIGCLAFSSPLDAHSVVMEGEPDTGRENRSNGDSRLRDGEKQPRIPIGRLSVMPFATSLMVEFMQFDRM